MGEWMRLVFGWLCYRIVLVVPINMNRRVYCWLLSWAGVYAYRVSAVKGE